MVFPMASVPFKKIRKNFGLLDRIFQCIVRMGAAVSLHVLNQMPPPSRCNRNVSLYSKSRLDIKALRVIEGRSNSGESNKVPVEKAPIKTQRIRNQYRPTAARNSPDPFSGIS